MAFKRRGEQQISEIANGIMDPVLARRAGITTALIGSWDEIAGEQFADCTRPEKIVWPRREPGDLVGHRPGQLVLACEGARALFLSHAQGEMRIVQKPVSQGHKLRPSLRPLPSREAKKLEEMMEGIESEALRAAVARLGRAVLQPGKRKV